MTTIVTRAGKGSSLTWAEGDANFTNLNNDKVEVSTLAASGGSDLVGYIQSGAGATARTVQDRLRESYVSVMDFGATGDGVTDDAPAIQAAIDSLVYGGGTVFFPKPASSYIIGTAINLSNLTNLTLLGVGGAEFNSAGVTQSTIKAKNTLTGPMFTTDTSTPFARTGGIVFQNLVLDGNNQNVDGYYIHASNGNGAQARFLEFTGCTFIRLRHGLWLGDYTNENPDFTYIIGCNVYRCWFVDCVRPIKSDAASFDGLSLEQVNIANENNKTIIGIEVIVNGATVTMKDVYFDLDSNATYGLYFHQANSLTMTNVVFEGRNGTETFVSLYQGTGTSLGGVIIDNCRIQSVVGATAIDVSNSNGMEIRSSAIDGNIVVNSNCKVIADNVVFLAGTFTGTTSNVYINGEASGTWTPTITFATPGDLAVTYSVQAGTWSKVGGQVTAWFEIATSSFTHTTASGNLLISGLPFTSVGLRQTSGAVGAYGGITSASNQHMGTVIVPSSTTANIFKSGSGVASSPVTAADMPTAGTVLLYGQISYRTATI